MVGSCRKFALGIMSTPASIAIYSEETKNELQWKSVKAKIYPPGFDKIESLSTLALSFSFFFKNRSKNV